MINSHNIWRTNTAQKLKKKKKIQFKMGKGLEEIPFKGVQVAKKHMEKKMANITNH